MTWNEIRQQYPHCWVLVEALDGYTQDNERVISQLALIETFADDWKPAWEAYKRWHHADQHREYYMLHTDREALNILVRGRFRRKAQH
jgi:hypothetical protein